MDEVPAHDRPGPDDEASAPVDDPCCRDAVVLFVAEGLVCERLDVPADRAMIALADIAASRGLNVVDVTWAVVAGVLDPREARSQ